MESFRRVPDFEEAVHYAPAGHLVQEKKAGFRSLTESVDTTTPGPG